MSKTVEKQVDTWKFEEDTIKYKLFTIIKRNWAGFHFLIGFLAGCQTVFWIYYFTVGPGG